jgi:hypothetical protein
VSNVRLELLRNSIFYLRETRQRAGDVEIMLVKASWSVPYMEMHLCELLRGSDVEKESFGEDIILCSPLRNI